MTGARAATENKALRVIFPKKGRLKDDFATLFAAAGFRTVKQNDRHDYGVTNDDTSEITPFETLLQRPADALENLADGTAYLAIVGLDNFEEARCHARAEGHELDIRVVREFNGVSACALHIAVPQGRDITDPQQLSGLRIATSYPFLLQSWLANENVSDVTIISRDGGIEDYIRLGKADVICDVVESGRTLTANGLEKSLKLFDSSAVLVERRGEWPDSFKDQAARIAARLDGAQQRPMATLSQQKNPARDQAVTAQPPAAPLAPAA